MARRLTALCLALGLLTALASGEAQARGSNCRTSGKTVIRNTLVRVYKKTTNVRGVDQGEETADRDEQRVWACRLATGQKLRLDDPCSPRDVAFSDLATCDEHWNVINIAGPYVGVYFNRNSSGFFNPNILVWARVDARPVRRVAYRLQKPGDSWTPRVDQLFVSDRGGLAFSMKGVHVKGEKENRSVIAKVAPLEAGHKPRYKQLDSGVQVVSASLRAAGRRLTWKHGARTRHARWR